jgi:flagellar biosynthesis protein FlhF
MTVHTYRARSLHEALRLVREELGPNASVLETREVGSTWSSWLVGSHVEVTASVDVQVPSQLPGGNRKSGVGSREYGFGHRELAPVFPADLIDFRQKFRSDLHTRADEGSSLVEQLAVRQSSRLSASVGQASRLSSYEDNRDGRLTIDSDLPIAEPLSIVPGKRLVVALVGPTGVGKTTTIAKLAAHFRLREHCRVGLVTVDTFRIAAVDQLRTYAELMDLPLHVVATPREMHGAIEHLSDMDLVLIDTAGRSPRDAVRLAELRRLLAESQADEVHLVLSAVAGKDSIDAACGAFSTVGTSALILTKLDEAASLDWLPRLLSQHRLPLRYTTSGQNVPDDIQPARDGLSSICLQWTQDGATERQRDGGKDEQSSFRPSVPPSLRLTTHHSPLTPPINARPGL